MLSDWCAPVLEVWRGLIQSVGFGMFGAIDRINEHGPCAAYQQYLNTVPTSPWLISEDLDHNLEVDAETTRIDIIPCYNWDSMDTIWLESQMVEATNFISRAKT